MLLLLPAELYSLAQLFFLFFFRGLIFIAQRFYFCCLNTDDNIREFLLCTKNGKIFILERWMIGVRASGESCAVKGIISSLGLKE